MKAEVTSFKATRYRCPHCGRTGGNKARVQAHANRCASDPQNNGCRTCAHDMAVDTRVMTDIGPAFKTVRYCEIGRRAEDALVIINCEHWRHAKHAAE